MTEKAEGLGELAQDIDNFLFRFAFHDLQKVAALQKEALEKWVPVCESLKGHADKLVDIDLGRAFVALEKAMQAFGKSDIRQFEDAVRVKLAVDAANVLLKQVIFAREYEGEVFEEGDEAFYLPPDEARNNALLVVLHGAFMKGRHFIWKWVFPAARRKLAVYAPASHGVTWSAVDFEWVESMIGKLAENYGLAKGETMLAGLSDGAVAGFELCCRKRTPFRKAAFLSGTRPFNVAMMPKLPLYIVHGTADPIFPIAHAQKTVESLRAQVGDVTYRELADAPHSFPYPEVEALMDWLVEARPRRKR
ncbi:MAG: hypothetical protein J4G10_02845 [Alphaproteobacteria bacterium]|nr:hypothetical protein [Alphaproteobacteria bacterium]